MFLENYYRESWSRYYCYSTSPIPMFVDNLLIYDGLNTSAPLLKSLSNSGFPTDPVITILSTGNVYASFTSDTTTAYTGFVGLFSRNDLCPNSCSGNGYCIQGKCVCFSDRIGPNCTDSVYALPVGFNTTVSDMLGDFEWKYYTFYIDDDMNRLEVPFAKLDAQPPNTFSGRWKWGGGDLTFVLGREYLPNLVTHDAMLPYWITPKKFILQRPRVGTWFLGVYAREAASFSFSVLSPSNNPTFGTTNEYTTAMATSSQVITPKSSIALILGIVVLILSLIALTAIGVAFYWFKVRKSSGSSSGFGFQKLAAEEGGDTTAPPQLELAEE